MDLKELKAHAYDCLANIQQWQSELEKTNIEISKLINTETPEVIPTEE